MSVDCTTSAERIARAASAPREESSAAERRAAHVDDVLQKCPESARKCLREAFLGIASPRAAIKATCLACVNFQREEIKRCPVYRCPLWLYRPFQDRVAAPIDSDSAEEGHR